MRLIRLKSTWIGEIIPGIELFYNIYDVKTSHRMINALSDIFEKLLVMNKVFIILVLVNMKLKEGGSMSEHVNEFNLIISRLIFVDIFFENEL